MLYELNTHPLQIHKSVLRIMENLSYYLLVLLPFVILIARKRYSSNLPPSPLALPLIGHLHLIKDPLHTSLASLSSRYGSIFHLRLGCQSFVVVSSPSAVAECFTKNDLVFANRPRSMSVDCLSYDYVTYTTSPHGDHWRNLRRLTVVEMLSSQRLQKSSEMRQQEISKIARVLRGKEGQKVDLNCLVSTYSFNILMRGLAGESFVDEEDIGTEAGKERVKQMKEIFLPNLLVGICDYFPVLRQIGYKNLERSLICLFKKRDKVLQSLIDKITEKNDMFDPKTETNMITTLLSLQASDPEFYTDSVIKSILLVLISAGTDTTALTMEWAMSLLISNPSEMQKLKHEIDENVGHDHLLNDSDLVKLPYLGCVVKETLRLHPAAPLLLPHYSSSDCVVSGYSIPKGTILLVNAWGMHRDATLWDDPDKFKPERFHGVDMERQFVPFGMGRRACPGATMALRMISLALGVFVQCFEWNKALEDVEIDLNAQVHLTLRKAKPLEAVCIPRIEAAHLLSQL